MLPEIPVSHKPSANACVLTSETHLQIITEKERAKEEKVRLQMERKKEREMKKKQAEQKRLEIDNRKQSKKSREQLTSLLTDEEELECVDPSIKTSLVDTRNHLSY